jgi:hypothetical protein
MLCLFLDLTIRQATAADCNNCDCIHLPCPEECKPCCGLLKGVIVSNKNDVLVVRGQKGSAEFKITPHTSIVGNITEGHQATAYFRKSGGDKVVQKVESEPKN